MGTKKNETTKEPDLRGLAVARHYAGWHLGCSGWADSIIEAYLNPEAAAKVLRQEMGDPYE